MKSVCCMSLKTAGVVIGCLGVILSFIEFITFIVNLAEHKNVSIPMEVMNIAFLASSVLVVVGAVKERHLMLIPWLIIDTIYLVMGSIGLYMTTLVVGVLADDTGRVVVFMILIFLPIILFCVFIWYTILCLYKELKENRNRERLLETPNAPYSRNIFKV